MKTNRKFNFFMTTTNQLIRERAYPWMNNVVFKHFNFSSINGVLRLKRIVFGLLFKNLLGENGTSDHARNQT